jgi:hypothetical protein
VPSGADAPSSSFFVLRSSLGTLHSALGTIY